MGRSDSAHARIISRLGTALSVDERMLWDQLRARYPVPAVECYVRGAAKGAGTVAERYAFEVARVAFAALFSFTEQPG